jgi:predicted short-subunit dehydrogenase-like oxidoreductase (DUF2520 family)
VTTIRLVGPGRAGRSLAAALQTVGVEVRGRLGRGDDPLHAAAGVDAVVLATPDRVVADVAATIRPEPSTVVVHLAGSLGLDVLAPHPRRASLHPLVPLPDPAVGRERLLAGATFAVAGDPLAEDLVRRLGGRAVTVPDDQRVRYHAAAAMAANHVVALLGQVESIAAAAGLHLDLFVGLTAAAVADAFRLGPARALTGPAARGDEETLARHRAVLPVEDRPAYDALAALARRLARQAAATGGTDPAGGTACGALRPDGALSPDRASNPALEVAAWS